MYYMLPLFLHSNEVNNDKVKFCSEIIKSGMGKYKRTVGNRRYQDYTPETLEQCLKKVGKKEISVVRASEMYRILKRTIFDKLKKKETSMNLCGRPTFFTVDEEEMFKEHLLFWPNLEFQSRRMI